MFSAISKTIIFSCLYFFMVAATSTASDHNRVIYTTDEALLSTTTSDGKSSGLFVDFFRQVATDANYPHAEVKILPWKRAQISAERGEIGVIGPITRTPKRETKYKWVGKLFPMRIVYVTLAGNMPINSLEMARQKVIAIKAGSASVFAAKKHDLPTEKLVTVSNQETILRMLEKGHVDGWLVWDVIAHRTVQKYGKHKNIQLQEGHVDVLGDLYLAASPQISDQELLVWRSALEKNIQSGELKSLLARYLQTDYLN